MKQLVMIAAVTAALCTSAFAGGSSKNGINIGASVSTGKGGLLGSLLGGSGRGNNGLKVDVAVVTGKNGLLGTLLGGNNSHHGGY
ncbi:MAG: hypothetical protein AB1490_17505 [Pseudomonadota bacterium]